MEFTENLFIVRGNPGDMVREQGIEFKRISFRIGDPDHSIYVLWTGAGDSEQTIKRANSVFGAALISVQTIKYEVPTVPRCPQCHEVLEYLDGHSREYHSFKQLPNGETSEDSCDEVDDVYYLCPHCGENIARSGEEMVRILRP